MTLTELETEVGPYAEWQWTTIKTLIACVRAADKMRDWVVLQSADAREAFCSPYDAIRKELENCRQ